MIQYSAGSIGSNFIPNVAPNEWPCSYNFLILLWHSLGSQNCVHAADPLPANPILSAKRWPALSKTDCAHRVPVLLCSQGTPRGGPWATSGPRGC